MEAISIRTKSLDLLRFPLALIVVFIHVFSVDVKQLIDLNINAGDSLGYEWLHKLIDILLRGISVPIYFFISGYVFFLCKSFNIETYKNKLKNRFRTLFVPYVIWNSLAIILVLIKSLPVFRSFLTYEGTGVDLSISNIMSCFWMYDGKLSSPPATVADYELFTQTTPYPINTALWFLRDLMLVVICSPILYFFIRKLHKYALIILGSLYLFSVFYIFDYHFTQLMTAFFFFSWGGYMSIHEIDMITTFKKYFLMSFLLFLLSFIFLLNVNNNTIYILLKQLNIFATLILAYNISARLIEANIVKVNKVLASSGFFIYVSHCLITARLTKVSALLLNPQSDGEICFVYLTSFVITIILLLSIYKLMDKYIPSVLRVITGRR